jgi:hypothetical protein
LQPSLLNALLTAPAGGAGAAGGLLDLIFLSKVRCAIESADDSWLNRRQQYVQMKKVHQLIREQVSWRRQTKRVEHVK